MRRAILAVGLACALSVAGQAFGGPYMFDGGRYEQKFEGLSWSNTGLGDSNFGTGLSGTEGWAAGYYETPILNYSFRQTSTEKKDSTRVGAAFIPTEATTLPDKSISRQSSGRTEYISLYLYNSSSSTVFDTLEFGFTAEAWLANPGAVADAAYEAKVNLRVGINTYGMTPRGNFIAAKQEIDSFAFATNVAGGYERVKTVTLTNLDWAPGESLALSWVFPKELYNANQIIGIDDIFVAVPEPSVVLTGMGVAMAGLSLRRRVGGRDRG